MAMCCILEQTCCLLSSGMVLIICRILGNILLPSASCSFCPLTCVYITGPHLCIAQKTSHRTLKTCNITRLRSVLTLQKRRHCYLLLCPRLVSKYITALNADGCCGLDGLPKNCSRVLAILLERSASFRRGEAFLPSMLMVSLSLTARPTVGFLR